MTTELPRISGRHRPLGPDSFDGRQPDDPRLTLGSRVDAPLQVTPAVRVEVVTEFERFLEMRVPWGVMLERSGSNSLTLTWEWLGSWWRVFHEQRGLRVILVWEGERLMGAAPLLRRSRLAWAGALVPTRRVELLASGEDPGHMICSDYIDWIAVLGREPLVVSLVLDTLQGREFGHWDEIQLADIPAQSPNLRALRQSCGEHNLEFEVLSRDPCQYIDLPGSWDAYLDSLTSGHRYRVRRALRDFEAAGGSYKVAVGANDLETMLPVLIALHQSRWQAKGEPGAFQSALRRRFHQLFMPLALERGWLRLGVLNARDRPIGAIYNLHYAGRVYFYQSGIEPQAANTLRPGVLLHAHEIAAAIGAGCHEYDFLKRGESTYKDAWARGSRDLLLLRIGRRDLHAGAARLARGMRAWAGRLKRQLLRR